VSAEIYISIDRIKENAQLFNVSFLNELYRVLIHGALHLCGYGDKTKKEALLMRKKENFYLEKIVPRGTKL
jgi:rRNA maturation RNase YbeY